MRTPSASEPIVHHTARHQAKTAPENKLAANVEGRGPNEFLVSNWKPYEKNSLRGFFSLTLPSGLIIHNCAVHQKGTARWVSLPARQLRKEDGSIAYSPVIDFAGTDERRRFQAVATKAVGLYLSEVE
jgi:DNA-binding cell septation regulator SpoVG